MPHYKDSASVYATRIHDDKVVKCKMTNLALYSSGAFSNVYRGELEEDLTHEKGNVAVKKTWRSNGNTNPNEMKTVSEIRILMLLNRLNHKNIVQLLYFFANKYSERTCYSLVFEFLPQTLYSYMREHGRHLDLVDIKLFAWQLFRGQAHLAKAQIVHRDIKPQNLLIEPKTGLLKISDFGSSTVLEKDVRQPSYHVTRYYRPPELLLEAKTYGTEVDVWSCGCVFGEMLACRTLLPGKNTEHQLDLVIDIFGLPTRNDAVAMHCPQRTFDKMNAKVYKKRQYYPRLFMLIPDHQPKEAVELLQRVLVYNPKERCCGVAFLTDPFFHDLFNGKSVRNGVKQDCLTMQDLVDVKNGDGDITAEEPTEEDENRPDSTATAIEASNDDSFRTMPALKTPS